MQTNLFRTCSAVVVVVSITFVVYMPTLRNGFINFDDYSYILQNPAIRSINLDLLKYAFGGFHFQYYIPFVWLSFAVDYFLWGLNPEGFHLTNNALHALNQAGLLF